MPTDFDAVVGNIKALVLRTPGGRLPPERELANLLKVGRPAIRRALARLEEQGLVVRRQGSGTFAVSTGHRELTSVGVLVDARLRLGDDPFFTRVLETVQRVLQEQHVRCLVHRLDEDGRGVVLEDGVLTLGLAGERFLARHTRTDPPAVGMFLSSPNRPTGRVSLLDLDDTDGGAQAAGELLRGGCAQILFVGHTDIPAARKRLEGAKEAARAGGPVPVTPLPAGMNYAAGLAAASEVQKLAQAERDARVGLIAANDWLALGLHTGLLGLGRSVRQRYQIASFDGLPVTAEPSLGIASLEAPIEEMATDAVNELRRLCASENAKGRKISYPMAWSRA